MTARPRSPYKGLNAFDDSDLDALLFFGREREREIVVANLIASRLTVLYGPSGVGKSSLLQAAVARRLRELPERPLVIVFSRWSEDPARALVDAIAEAGANGAADGTASSALEEAQSGRDVYLVLDQAEEYFLYHADDAGPGSFAEALPAVLSAPLRVNVLVSLREDALAKLDRFTGRIPGLFANTLRLDRLDRAAARGAITRPLERYGELVGETVTIEPELVERILDEVGAGQIESALGGLGAVEGNGGGRGVEAPYLQLVLQRLWDEERSAGSAVLRLETFERLGGAQHIVEEHLEGAMAELSPEQKDVAGRLFNHLVTPSGTKIAHETADLADFGQVSVAELRPVLDILTSRRILRSIEEGGDVRYEIFHDVLAEPVLAWRATHEAERELELQKKASNRRQRRLLGVIAVGAVLFAAMGAVTLYALSQRREVRERALAFHVHELEARSDAELSRDPELSMLLALEAVRQIPSESSKEALRQALVQSRVQQTVVVGEPLLAAKTHGREVLAVTADGDLVVSSGSGGELQRVSTDVQAVDASFSNDGTALVTGRDGQARVVTRDGTVRAIPEVGDAEGAALSPDASLAAVVESAAVRLLDVESGRVLETYPHPDAISAAISQDNRRVVTGGVDDKVTVWSGQSGRRVHALRDHTGRPVSLAFSPDGRYVASASADGSGRVWRTVDWGLQSTLGGHMLGLTDIDFSTDGDHVVTSSVDGTARVSLAESGTPLIVLAGSKGWVTSATFTGPSGTSVVTASSDGAARVWDASFQPELDELAALGTPVEFVEVDGDGRVRAEARDGKTHVLDAASGEEIRADPGTLSRRRVVGPNGATATIRGNTVVLHAPDGRTTVLEGHRDDVRSVSFSPDGRQIVTASRDHDVRIWDAETGEAVGSPLQHNSEVRDARFSPDGRWIVTAAGRAALFDARDGTLVMRLQGHEGPLTSVAFDPTSRTIVTGGVDGTVRRYECEFCGGLDELVELAERRLAATGRELTADEREQYFG